MTQNAVRMDSNHMTFLLLYKDKKKMDGEDYEHAVAAHIAYSFYENGYEAAQEELAQRLPRHSIDEDLSDDRFVTVQKPDGGAIVAYRGTDPTNFYDLSADALVFLGYHRERSIPGIYTRFQAASDAYKIAKAKHGDVTTAGHSLGGTLADYVGRMHNARAFAFNPGETPFEYTREKGEASRTKVFTTAVDPISISAYAHRTTQDITVVPQTVPGSILGAHSRFNFLITPKQSQSVQTRRLKPEPLRAPRTLCELRPELCLKGH